MLCCPIRCSLGFATVRIPELTGERSDVAYLIRQKRWLQTPIGGRTQ